MKNKISIFWFRRDLRLSDNTGLLAASQGGYPALPIFIFDTKILDKLEADDARVTFIHDQLSGIQDTLEKEWKTLRVYYGDPQEIWNEIVNEYDVQGVYLNRDYEPYAQERDGNIYDILTSRGIPMHGFKDQVMFEKSDVTKDDGKPYTVYTPYKNKWLSYFHAPEYLPKGRPDMETLMSGTFEMPTLQDMGFQRSGIRVKDFDLSKISEYASRRDFPIDDVGSYLSPHLRFGTVSIRQIIAQMHDPDGVFLSELIWREFFMQILCHFPHVKDQSFRPQYDAIEWRNNPDELQAWKEGKTGYPIVDAGMRQLNETGYMHNRVRMVVASFLCKHLLIDWREGERYFASKLLDYDMSANNGNWQWAAGTGCDAAPYFRVFNPHEQLKKFDKDLAYVKTWIPEYEPGYLPEIVEHKMARVRAIEAYKEGLLGA